MQKIYKTLPIDNSSLYYFAVINDLKFEDKDMRVSI